MRALPLVALALALLLAASCGKDGKEKGVWGTHRVTVDTVYYLHGPQQASPPDGTLPAGTEVRVAKSAGSYTEVTTKDGKSMYVATDALQPLGG